MHSTVLALPLHPLLDEGGDVGGGVGSEELQALPKQRPPHRARWEDAVALRVPPIVQPVGEDDEDEYSTNVEKCRKHWSQSNLN